MEDHVLVVEMMQNDEVKRVFKTTFVIKVDEPIIPGPEWTVLSITIKKVKRRERQKV